MSLRFTNLAPLACAALAASLALSSGAVQAKVRHRHAAPVRPVVVELFTAQGCATCQPASALLAALAKRKDVVALTFSVDIWDFLGWPDSFAQPEFTARERAYVRRLKLREISTPQMVVQGAAPSAGLDKDEVDGLIEDAKPARAPSVSVAKGGKRVSIGSGPAPSGGADVWLIRYDPKPREVHIKTGESKGKIVTEIAVVRELTKLGSWRGGAKSFALPAYTPPAASAPSPGSQTAAAPATPPETLKTAVIVQAPHVGRIIAAGKD